MSAQCGIDLYFLKIGGGGALVGSITPISYNPTSPRYPLGLEQNVIRSQPMNKCISIQEVIRCSMNSRIDIGEYSRYSDFQDIQAFQDIQEFN